MRTATARAAQALLAVSVALSAFNARAAAPEEIRQALIAEARQSEAAFTGFSAQRGRAFFTTRHGGEWACASCHMDNPLDPGKHARTGKVIAPLAPAANPRRFTDTAKVEKWFKRNCSDVLNRPCTAREKGDVVEYLMSLAK